MILLRRIRPISSTKFCFVHKEGQIKKICAEQLDDYLTQGWLRGRGIPAWNKGLTKETDERVALNIQRSQNTRQKWSPEERAKFCQAVSLGNKGRKWSPESIAKRSATRRGFKPSEEQRAKTSASLKGHPVSMETREKLSKREVTWSYCPSEEQRQASSELRRSEEYKARRYNKMKERGTLNSSKPEKDLEQRLTSLFGTEDVLSQYRDARYPFACDFYIKSLDLFIELNLHWTHGKKPFNSEDSQCCEKLLDWQERAKESKFYKQAIYVWTDLDTRKQIAAQEAGLNYVTFYSLEEVDIWFERQASQLGQKYFPEDSDKT